jgi:hypothetical protein
MVMMDVSQAAQGVTLYAGAAPAQIAPKQRTTSSSQPPSARARHLLALYANLFGAGLAIVFAAAALAMLAELRQVEPTNAAWWQPWELPPWHLVALLVCSLPYILAFCAVNLYRWSAFSRYDFRLVWQERSANPSLNDHDWRDLAQRAVEVWNYESRRFSESRRMASLHGLIFGLVSSLTLFICTMILARYLYGAAEASTSELALVALAVGTATAFAFANDLGRIIFRVALRDAGAEIFSFATKNSILVVASALLFSTLLCSGLAQINQPAGAGDHAIPLGVPGFIVIGATIAILGGRAVRFVSDRAASVLGLAAARGVEISDLTEVEGLGDEDIGRLAEEGVDSLHALAFIPLPRLLFNTKYGLERLCDWQDQALLLAHVGQAKARLLREHLLVRGALGAQDAARQFFSRTPDGGAPAGAGAEASTQDKLANLLGFVSYEHARFALNELASDEVVNRLRVYATAAHTLEWPDDGDGYGG